MRMIFVFIVRDARAIWAILINKFGLHQGSAMLFMLPAAAQSRKMPKSLPPCQS